MCDSLSLSLFLSFPEGETGMGTYTLYQGLFIHSSTHLFWQFERVSRNLPSTCLRIGKNNHVGDLHIQRSSESIHHIISNILGQKRMETLVDLELESKRICSQIVLRGFFFPKKKGRERIYIHVVFVCVRAFIFDQPCLPCHCLL